MTFEEALRSEVSSVSGLASKVFPLLARSQNQSLLAAPYVAYVSTEGLQEKSLEGYDASRRVSCEIHVVQTSYTSMKSLTKLVMAKILTFQSRVIGTGGPYIQNVTYQEPVELYDDEPKLYRCVIQYEFYF
jgi:hypothetical protein